MAVYRYIFFSQVLAVKLTVVWEGEYMEKKSKPLKCPRCEKRACDISDIPKEKIFIEMKCPQCHNIVRIWCNKESLKIASPFN